LTDSTETWPYTRYANSTQALSRVASAVRAATALRATPTPTARTPRSPRPGRRQRAAPPVATDAEHQEAAGAIIVMLGAALGEYRIGAADNVDAIRGCSALRCMVS